jgi:hypothetical protein
MAETECLKVGAQALERVALVSHPAVSRVYSPAELTLVARQRNHQIVRLGLAAYHRSPIVKLPLRQDGHQRRVDRDLTRHVGLGSPLVIARRDKDAAQLWLARGRPNRSGPAAASAAREGLI